MYRNRIRCIVKDEDIVATRGNSGPTFNMKKTNCEAFKDRVGRSAPKISQLCVICNYSVISQYIWTYYISN